MSLGFYIRLALVCLVLGDICVHCTEPQRSGYVSKGSQQKGLQAAQSIWVSSFAEDFMEFPPLPRERSDGVQKESYSPAAHNVSPGRQQFSQEYSSYSQSNVPSTKTASRDPDYSFQGTDSTDSGPVTMVHISHRPVDSQFGHWSTKQFESGAVGKGNLAVNSHASSVHSGQASNGVKPAHHLGAGQDAAVSMSATKEPYKGLFKGKDVLYVKLKPRSRLNATRPYSLHEGQAQYALSDVGSSYYAHSGKVNSPVESNNVHGLPVGHQSPFENAALEMVATPLLDKHRNAGDLRKAMSIETSHSFGVPSPSSRVWAQGRVSPAAEIHPSVNHEPHQSYSMHQATKSSQDVHDHGSEMQKNPRTSQTLSVQDPSTIPTKVTTYGISHSGPSVYDAPKHSANFVSNAGVLGNYGSVQPTNDWHSKPAAAFGKMGQSMDTTFEQNRYEGENSPPNPANPQYSSGATLALPVQHQPTKTDSQNLFPDTTRDYQSGGFSGTELVYGSVSHIGTQKYSTDRTVPKGASSVLLQTKTSRYAPQPHSSMTLQHRYQNSKASNTFGGTLSHAYTRSGQNALSQQSLPAGTIIRANGYFNPKSGFQSSIGAKRGDSRSQGIGKGSSIQTKFGNIGVPSAVNVDFEGPLGPTRGSRVPFAVLKRLSELDFRLARLTQAKIPTSSYVIGKRAKSSSGSPTKKTLKKFKPLSLADIGASVAYGAKKPRSASKSVENAVLADLIQTTEAVHEAHRFDSVPGRWKNGFSETFKQGDSEAGLHGSFGVAQHRLGNMASTKVIDSSGHSSELYSRKPSRLNAKQISGMNLAQAKFVPHQDIQVSMNKSVFSQSVESELGKLSVLQTPGPFSAHKQRNQGPSDQHPQQSQQAQQSLLHDAIINVHGRFTLRPGHQNGGSSQDGVVSGNQSMTRSANSEGDNRLGSFHSTNGFMSPSAVAHAGSDGQRSVELNKTVVDPTTASLTQSKTSTSSFAAGRHVIKNGGTALVKLLSSPEQLQQIKTMIDLKLLNSSGFSAVVLGAKGLSDPLSDVDVDADHVQAISNSTEAVGDLQSLGSIPSGHDANFDLESSGVPDGTTLRP